MTADVLKSFFDELEKISTGLAPAGAPTVNSKGAGMGVPKTPRITPAPKPMSTMTAGPGAMPKTGF